MLNVVTTSTSLPGILPPLDMLIYWRFVTIIVDGYHGLGTKPLFLAKYQFSRICMYVDCACGIWHKSANWQFWTQRVGLFITSWEAQFVETNVTVNITNNAGLLINREKAIRGRPQFFPLTFFDLLNSLQYTEKSSNFTPRLHVQIQKALSSRGFTPKFPTKGFSHELLGAPQIPDLGSRSEIATKLPEF